MNRQLPKLVLTDIDGVWTDGGMYYDDRENELKKFNTGDSAGVIFCKINNIHVGVLTGEKTRIMERRATKLGINILHQGCEYKLKTAMMVASKLEIDLSETAYIGDDFKDIPLLKTVGFSASVPNAPEYVRKQAEYITTKKGGEGAFRDFVEYLLRKAGKLEDTINRLVKDIS